MSLKLNLIMGARNGAKEAREENDFYATHPNAIRTFLDFLNTDNSFNFNSNIWECSCGMGHISEVFKEYGYDVYSSDLINREYNDLHSLGSFLDDNFNPFTTPNASVDVVTNPPFNLAEKFAYKALGRINNGFNVAFFLKLQFLESKARAELFRKYPPKYVYVYSERQHCAKNADFENLTAKTQAYMWIIWEKGFNGNTTLKWIN